MAQAKQARNPHTTDAQFVLFRLEGSLVQAPGSADGTRTSWFHKNPTQALKTPHEEGDQCHMWSHTFIKMSFVAF